MKNSNIRLAVCGLGQRGISSLKLLCDLEDCDIVAVCDVYDDRIAEAQNIVLEKTNKNARGFIDYREMFEKEAIDAVYISTSWECHIDIALCAMDHKVYPGLECGGSNSIEQCWSLIRKYEETGVPVMFLENCCYGRFEMTVLRLVKEGKFGELVHAEGGYRHDLQDEIALGREKRHYRFRNYLNRNGDLYPQHALGPIMKDMDINRGNRLLTLTSMASKACGLKDFYKRTMPDYYDGKELEFKQGDIVTTMIKCAGGETITLTHDTSLPRPYSRGNVLQGTRGIWCEPGYGLASGGIAMMGVTKETHKFENFGVLLDDPAIEHPLWTKYRHDGVKEGGHDGMDWLVFCAFIHCVRNEIEPPIDVYDAATLMSIVPLTEQSVAMGSMPVSIPDFTNGKWLKREEAPKHKYSLDKIYYDLYED